jgi:hypothetical protein
MRSAANQILYRSADLYRSVGPKFESHSVTNAVASPTLGAPASRGASQAATLRSPGLRLGLGFGSGFGLGGLGHCARLGAVSLETRPETRRPEAWAAAVPNGMPVQGEAQACAREQQQTARDLLV